MADLEVTVGRGEYSRAVRQDLINSGSLAFASVGLDATPWRFSSDGGPGAGADLPASVTEVLDHAAGGGYVPLADGVAVGRGLAGGDVSQLSFRVNLSAHGDARGIMAQNVTYLAECVPP